MTKKVIAILVGSLALGVLADGPTVGDVTVRQRWPWSRLVDIDYVLTGEVGQKADVLIKGYNGATALDIPMNAFSGDLYNVEQGFRRIVFDPSKTAYTNQPITQFRVKVEALSPLYAIIDLTHETETGNQIVYLTEEDLAGGAYGSVQTNPINGIASIIWTGVTNDTTYTTSKLVMRRIPAGTFIMGEGTGAKTVTLTKDYYISVFELTQRQWYCLMDNTWPPSAYSNTDFRDSRPADQTSYNAIRGSANGTNWPSSRAVDDSSLVGKLRTRTGVDAFDLPTEAQWEYACRAGTTNAYNNGSNIPPDGAESNTVMDVLGRYKSNGGYINGAAPSSNVGLTNATAKVGTYLPNAWGLYDMHGNVAEWCLDWMTGTLPGGTDPVGRATGTGRSRRGGSFGHTAEGCRSGLLNGLDPSSAWATMGFRLAWPLP